MSAIEKIIEHLPYGDGAIRRRFYVGLIFVSLFLAHSYAIHSATGNPALTITNLSQRVGFEPKDFLKNTQALFVAGIIVFVLGSILDAMIDAFILRGVSISLAVFNWIISVADSSSIVVRLVWKVFTSLWSFAIWPVEIIACSVLNTAGLNWMNKVGLDANDGLSERAANFYKATLPTSIQTGLNEVYGDLSGVAWLRLMDFVPEAHRPWVGRLNARNRDVASFIASAILALVISTVVNYVSMKLIMHIITYSAICVLSYLFLGCAAIVRRSTIAVLELVAATHK